MDVALIKLEKNPGETEILSQIFRLVHTIKGTCGFLGLPRLELVAHAAENVLGRVRDRQLAVSAEVVNLVLAALDRVKAILAALAASGAEPQGDDSALLAALDALANGTPAAVTAAPAAPEIPAQAAEPPAADPHAAPLAPSAQAVEAPAPEAPPAEAQAGPQTIRVGVDVLEDLMTLVSELVLTRNQLLQLARTQTGAESLTTLLASPLQRLSHITTDLQEGVMKTRMQPIGNAWNKLPRLVRDLARDLGKSIELRMLGAETELDRQVLELIKDPLTHMVRNSADHGLESPAARRAAGKPETGHITLNAFHEGGHIIIEIADDGAGLPVDKIRARAAARGLASEAELAAMSEAQILRFIFHPGFSTAAAITAVSGRGVGMDVVKTNVERIGGTIDLRSVPGAGTTFTIKIPLTLAIVSALIVEAGGERFAIPQISVVELVRSGTAEGAAPDARACGASPDQRASGTPSDQRASGTPSDQRASGMSSDQRASGATIERIDNTPVLRLRDRLLPLVSLEELLRLERRGAADAGTAQPTIVVAQVGATLLGIIVDRVFDTEEIVVKPVAPILRHVTMFSGNTILGDGSVIMILDPNGIARALGMGAGAEARGCAQAASDLVRSDRATPMLIFRAGTDAPKAVPLGLVARLEEIPRERIERAGGLLMTQYRGRLMKLLPLAEPGTGAVQPVLVFTDRDRAMALMVDEIVDVVEEVLSLEVSAARPSVLGTAVIAGRATEVIDTGHYLTCAFQDWFRAGGTGGAPDGAGRKRLLVVEDSAFFRELLVPALSAAGYDVTATESAVRALALRDAGAGFDAVVSDIDMPDMDGLEFARRVRAGGNWAALPMVALTGRDRPEDEAAGRAAGFTDYVTKYDGDALLASLRQCLEQAEAGSARQPAAIA